MKILFIIPSNKSLFGHKYTIPGHPHVGIAYLTAFLRKNSSYDIKIYDDQIKNKTPLANEIKEYNPDLIGITVFSYCYEYAKDLISLIKSNTDIPIVLGGPHVAALRKEVLEDIEVDFAIKQEGELSLLDLIDEIQKETANFSKVKGLIWRKNGEIIENKDMPFIMDLNSLPFPDYNSFDIKKYACYKVKSVPIVTSRGCPFSCNYCSTFLSMGKFFRVRSAENVVDEIKQRFSEGFINFDINDDCFSLDIKRAERICDLIIDNKIKIHFQCYSGFRVDAVTPELLQKLKRAGCYFITYGCESGNEKILKTIKKSITLQQVRNAVEWTNNAGIKCCINFIIGHTEETYDQAKDTIKFARTLNASYFNFSNLIPYPGTEAYQWVKKNANLLLPPEIYLRNISTYDNQPIFETKEFTRQQRIELIKKGFNLYYKKILSWRLGNLLGTIIYYLTRNQKVMKVASDFAINKKIGRFIFITLSKKSRR